MTDCVMAEEDGEKAIEVNQGFDWDCFTANELIKMMIAGGFLSEGELVTRENLDSCLSYYGHSAMLEDIYRKLF